MQSKVTSKFITHSETLGILPTHLLVCMNLIDTSYTRMMFVVYGVYTFENMAACCVSKNLSLCEARDSRAVYGCVELCLEESAIALASHSPFESTSAIKQVNVGRPCGWERRETFQNSGWS